MEIANWNLQSCKKTDRRMRSYATNTLATKTAPMGQTYYQDKVMWWYEQDSVLKPGYG